MNLQLLSFVLPITLKENVLGLKWRDAPDAACGLRFQLLLKSFLRTFDLEELARFLVVCPASDEETIHGMLREITPDLRFQVVNELAICPELAEPSKKGIPVPGWYTQQIIKLAAAKIIESSFYLTLDSDIICRKSFSINSLIPGGKALANVETPKVYHCIYKERVAREEWLIKRHRLLSSAGLLGYRRKERYRYQSYGETPVLLHTPSVRELLVFLDQRYGNWFHCLAENRGWTEYSLFFQFMEMHDRLEVHYQRSGHNAVLDLEGSVWKHSDWCARPRDYSAKSILSGSGAQAGPFLAIQSYLPTDRWLPAAYPDLGSFYADLERHLSGESYG